jgi:hypothetical protein
MYSRVRSCVKAAIVVVAVIREVVATVVKVEEDMAAAVTSKVCNIHYGWMCLQMFSCPGGGGYSGGGYNY